MKDSKSPWRWWGERQISEGNTGVSLWETVSLKYLSHAGNTNARSLQKSKPSKNFLDPFTSLFLCLQRWRVRGQQDDRRGGEAGWGTRNVTDHTPPWFQAVPLQPDQLWLGQGRERSPDFRSRLKFWLAGHFNYKISQCFEETGEQSALPWSDQTNSGVCPSFHPGPHTWEFNEGSQTPPHWSLCRIAPSYVFLLA